jgi:hypothetical protein
METDGNTPNLRQAEHAAVQHRTPTVLRIGECVIAPPASEAGIARLLARLHAAEEGLEGALDAQDHVLQDLGIHLGVFRTCHLQVRQFRLLLIVGDGDVAAFPGRLALFQGSIVEVTAVPQDRLQRLLLLRR